MSTHVRTGTTGATTTHTLHQPSKKLEREERQSYHQLLLKQFHEQQIPYTFCFRFPLIFLGPRLVGAIVAATNFYQLFYFFGGIFFITNYNLDDENHTLNIYPLVMDILLSTLLCSASIFLVLAGHAKSIIKLWMRSMLAVLIGEGIAIALVYQEYNDARELMKKTMKRTSIENELEPYRVNMVVARVQTAFRFTMFFYTLTVYLYFSYCMFVYMDQVLPLASGETVLDISTIFTDNESSIGTPDEDLHDLEFEINEHLLKPEQPIQGLDEAKGQKKKKKLLDKKRKQHRRYKRRRRHRFRTTRTHPQKPITILTKVL